METIGLFYGSDTGMTEEITYSIVDLWEATEIEVIEISNATVADFDKYTILMLGLSTWYDGDLQSEWETYYDEFKTIDFTGKKVAIYGLGDQYGYGEYFIDGVGMLAEVVLNNGGKIVGNWPIKGYDFAESKAEIESKDLFYGLAIDEDNEPEKTQERLTAWLKQVERELVL